MSERDLAELYAAYRQLGVKHLARGFRSDLRGAACEAAPSRSGLSEQHSSQVQCYSRALWQHILSTYICPPPSSGTAYVGATVNFMQEFGAEVTYSPISEHNIRIGAKPYRATNLIVEGDGAVAAYIAGASAVGGRPVTIANVGSDTPQLEYVFFRHPMCIYSACSEGRASG